MEQGGLWENALLVLHADNGGEIMGAGTCGGNNWWAHALSAAALVFFRALCLVIVLSFSLACRPQPPGAEALRLGVCGAACGRTVTPRMHGFTRRDGGPPRT